MALRSSTCQVRSSQHASKTAPQQVLRQDRKVPVPLRTLAAVRHPRRGSASAAVPACGLMHCSSLALTSEAPAEEGTLATLGCTSYLVCAMQGSPSWGCNGKLFSGAHGPRSAKVLCRATSNASISTFQLSRRAICATVSFILTPGLGLPRNVP